MSAAPLDSLGLRRGFRLRTVVGHLQVLFKPIRPILRLAALGARVSTAGVVIFLADAAEHLMAAKTLIHDRTHRSVFSDVDHKSFPVRNISATELTGVVHRVLLQHVHLVFFCVCVSGSAKFAEHQSLYGMSPQLAMSFETRVAVPAKCALVRTDIAALLVASHCLLQKLSPETQIECTQVLITFICHHHKETILPQLRVLII